MKTSTRKLADARGAIPAAMQFLSSTRCYLHYLHGRDDNNLDWSAQEELALRGIGTGIGPVSPAEWMRLYFGHAKAVYRSNLQLLSQVSQAPLVPIPVVSALALAHLELRIFRDRWSRLFPAGRRRA